MVPSLKKKLTSQPNFPSVSSIEISRSSESFALIFPLHPKIIRKCNKSAKMLPPRANCANRRNINKQFSLSTSESLKRKLNYKQADRIQNRNVSDISSDISFSSQKTTKITDGSK